MTHYETLGVSPAASLDEIKKRYRDLARRHHPDVTRGQGSEERIREINEAYRILSDSSRRSVYDANLKLASHVPGFQDIHNKPAIEKTGCVVCHGRSFRCLGCH